MDVSSHILIVLASALLVLGSTQDATYIGCFNVPTRKMPERVNHFQRGALDMVSGCIDHCYDEGYQYAALKRDVDECGCGRDIPNVSDKQEDISCLFKCPGNSSLTCGSYRFYSVYEINSFHTKIDIDRMEGFLYGFMNGVGFINLTSPEESQTVLRIPSERVKQVDFHWRKQMVFASTTLHKYSSHLSGNSSAKPLAGMQSTSCEAIAVDWLHDRLFWADCDERVSIKSSDLDGTNSVSLIVRNVKLPINRMEVDPIDAKVFWMFGKTIESCSLDGTNLHMNLTRTSFSLRGLALDLSSKRLFFVGIPHNASAVLYSIGYSGNQLTVHWGSDQLTAVYGLSVFRDIVYWTNYQGKDVMFEAPLNDSSATRMISAVKESVWHVRLVHPDLQPQPSGDPCDGLQCSFHCDGGRCVCPEANHLAPDLRTCRGNNESLVNVSFVGCYGAVSESAIGESTFYIVNTTLGKCIDQCRVHNARYAAIDISSSVCHCGPDIPYESNKFDEALCDSACPDNATTSCGGYGVNSVYDVSDAKTAVYRDGASMLVGTSDSVLMLNTSRKFAYGTLRKSKSHIDAVDYHWEKQLAFSIDTSGKMFRSSLNWPSGNQTNISSVQIHTMTRCEGFAVDWIHDRIFWAHCEDDFYDYEEVPSHAPVMSIRTINLEGTDEKTLVTQNADIVVRRMAVDPYAGKLFWIAGGNSVDACDVDGNNVHTVYHKNASEVGRPPYVMREIFLDLTSRRIFYVADTGRLALSSMDYAGGDRKDHWSNVNELRYVYGLGVVNGIVYWVNWLVMSSDVLYQAPLSDPSKLEVVRAISGVWHMRVVHPSLQSDPCAVPDCKTECDHHQSTACQCPTHCEIVSEALRVAPVVESVFLGAVLLAAIVSAVFLLLYFSDKYWSLIRSRITRTSVTSYRQNRDSFPDGAVSEDNVNLVDD